MKKIRAIVTGRVQGVWFRASTYERAVALGVKGYVRNLAGGDVEFVAEGEDAQVNALVQWAKIGPPLAEVDAVRIENLKYTGEYTDFSVRH